MAKKLLVDKVRVTGKDENGYRAIEVDRAGEPLSFPIMFSDTSISQQGIDKLIKLIKKEMALI